MKFKGAIILSVVFHISLFALAIYFPRTQISNEPTYYVDLISFSGSGGGGRGSTAPPTLKKNASEEAATTPQSTLRMKDLTVKKETQSLLRYPKKTKGKKNKTPKKAKKKEPERQEMISVVRKPRRNPSTTDKGTEKQNIEKGKNAVNMLRKVVSLGTGSGSGYGTGTGSGFGSGMGGSGSSSPYAYYYDQIIQEVSSSWYSSLISPGLKGKFITTVYFKIFRNGEVKDIKIERKSGIRSLDMSANRAIENAAPFPQLPADYPYQYLIVHFDFTWEK